MRPQQRAVNIEKTLSATKEFHSARIRIVTKK
jgi:hypothetical protein